MKKKLAYKAGLTLPLCGENCPSPRNFQGFKNSFSRFQDFNVDIKKRFQEFKVEHLKNSRFLYWKTSGYQDFKAEESFNISRFQSWMYKIRGPFSPLSSIVVDGLLMSAFCSCFKTKNCSAVLGLGLVLECQDLSWNGSGYSVGLGCRWLGRSDVFR